MEHDGDKSVGRCKKGEIDLRCMQKLHKHGFLKLLGSVPGSSEKYCTIEKKKTNKNKQTDKKQITEIECSKLFISPIIDKSHSFIFVMKDLKACNMPATSLIFLELTTLYSLQSYKELVLRAKSTPVSRTGTIKSSLIEIINIHCNICCLTHLGKWS